MSEVLELSEEAKIETNQCKNQKNPKDINNLIMIQSLLRAYHTCKLFRLVKTMPSVPHTEIFTDLSLLKSHLSAYINVKIIDYLEKDGMYFKLEDLKDKSWSGPFTTDFTNFYYGEIDDQHNPHGLGILMSFNSIYEGQFSYGKYSGDGRMIDDKNGIYKGNWQSGKKHGIGTMIYWDGFKYSGNWENNQKNGRGIYNGIDWVYEGNFERDLKNGYGEENYKNSEYIYKGNFINGTFGGFGIIVGINNEKYEGEWKNGSFHGKGTVWHRDGWTFIGKFANGKRSGFGILQNEQLKYENEWKNGIGIGEYNCYSANKKYVMKGCWIDFKARNHMDEIIPNLFLGNHAAASNEKWLREIGIKHIVRVLDEENVKLLPGFTYFYVKAKDSEAENITQYLDDAIHFISNTLRKGKKILVHCYAGISRSPTIVLAYIMKKLDKDLDEAYHLLKERRACINPNKGFIKQLKEFNTKKRQA